MAANKAICYEAVQVVYRNAVVSHIRNVLTRTAADKLQVIVQDVMGEVRWAEAQAMSAKAKASSGMAINPVDGFDLIGVEHFYLFLNKYFSDLCPSPKGIEPAIWRSSKRQLLDWVEIIREGRNAISHPTDDDLEFSDAYRILDTCRRILQKLGIDKDASVIMELARGLDGYSFLEENTLESSLPNPERIVVEFMGRGKELNQLRDWFYDPRTRHWLLAGDGGKGKSALAYQFACEVRETAPVPYQVVAWLSAKKRQFQDGRSGILPQPDFSDLESALSKILIVYGFNEEISQDIDTKRQLVMDLLSNLPALLVIDDVDSIDTESENVIDFFQSEISLTKTKVLFTSRRTLFGMGGTTTIVEGFKGKEGEEFVRSRQRLMGIDAVWTIKEISEILRVTEGSPLYITDLIRLIKFMVPREACAAWAKREGKEARRFALGRELELLSKEARHVLLAACVTAGVTSRVELENITGYSSDIVISALHELNKLFLSPKPRIVEGEERYEISDNVRLLVRDVEGSTHSFRNMDAAYKAISGQLPRIRDERVGSIVRQAVLKQKQGDFEGAEKLLLKSLDVFPNHPVLVGFLGWVYKTWAPPRITEARELFRRADSLGGGDLQMYRHWAEMEGKQGDWGTAAVVAEKGSTKEPTNKDLLFAAGYARSRYARVLLQTAQVVGARQEFEKARNHLALALTPADELPTHGRAVNAKVYRAIVLVCEKLGDSDELYRFFEMWAAEHPDDPDVESERGRLLHRFPFLG
jgi:tetratricopeptide (TPR) repeat protein